MDRRKFIQNSLMGLGALALGETASHAQGFSSSKSSAKPEDWSIVSDKTHDGVRSLVVTPSQKVCPSQLELDIVIKDRTLKDFHFAGGCPGNARAVALLTKGMKISDVIAKFRGLPCGRRGTSCPDQLARVLESLQW